jgi:hypothetical protein
MANYIAHTQSAGSYVAYVQGEFGADTYRPQFRYIPATLDGAAVNIGDGTVRIHTLCFETSTFATPFWVRLDGVSGPVHRINELPASITVRCGNIQIFSAAP